jgi:hypothetical protein
VPKRNRLSQREKDETFPEHTIFRTGVQQDDARSDDHVGSQLLDELAHRRGVSGLGATAPLEQVACQLHDLAPVAGVDSASDPVRGQGREHAALARR